MSINLFEPKVSLRTLKPYEPGLSVEALQRRIGTDKPIVKLGSNESPLGPFLSVQTAIAEAIPQLNRYPDGAFFDLRKTISDDTGVDIEHVAVGNGADSLLVNLSLALLEAGDEVVFGWPSFVTYMLSVKKVGAKPIAVPLTGDYRYDLDAMLGAVTERTKLVYVCNPNNPTGTYVTRAELKSFIEALPDHVLCVIDEAYNEYVDAPDYPRGVDEFIVADQRSNVMVVRTMSKIYGLAGLRIGWAVGPESVVHALDTVRGPFEMNALANVAALASFAARDELASRAESTKSGRMKLEQLLTALGFAPIKNQVANFLCVALSESISPSEIARALQDEGVIIRPVAGFGMPNGVRISIGSENDMAYAAQVFEQVLPSFK